MIKNQRGDTIIEVILAGSILALVTVSSFAIMQQGSSSAFDALERSIVRLQLNGQAELLTYFRDQYSQAVINGTTITGTPAEVWQTIAARPNITAPTVSTCAAPSSSFYLQEATSGAPRYVLNTTNTAAAGRPSPGNGIWIGKVDSTSASPRKKYQEFYIVACWPSTTGTTNTMSSVVRLYDPIP